MKSVWHTAGNAWLERYLQKQGAASSVMDRLNHIPAEIIGKSDIPAPVVVPPTGIVAPGRGGKNAFHGLTHFCAIFSEGIIYGKRN